MPENEEFSVSPLAAVVVFDPVAGAPGPEAHGGGLNSVVSEPTKVPLPISVPVTVPLNVVWFCTTDEITPDPRTSNGIVGAGETPVSMSVWNGGFTATAQPAATQ